MTTGVLDIGQSLVKRYLLQYMLGDVSQYQRLLGDACKISIILINNRSNLKYRKILSIIFGTISHSLKCFAQIQKLFFLSISINFRDLALEVLLREPDGAFLVRESHSRTSGLALSVRVPLDFHPGGIAHYLIVRAPKGFRIKVRMQSISLKEI
jgi:hypothetical protein